MSQCLKKNDNAAAHYNFDAYQLILIILAETLLRQYAIKRWFVIPPLLTNVSASPRETWSPEIVFSVMLYTMSRKRNG